MPNSIFSRSQKPTKDSLSGSDYLIIGYKCDKFELVSSVHSALVYPSIKPHIPGYYSMCDVRNEEDIFSTMTRAMDSLTNSLDYVKTGLHAPGVLCILMKMSIKKSHFAGSFPVAKIVILRIEPSGLAKMFLGAVMVRLYFIEIRRM
jgi:hypothetical protein